MPQFTFENTGTGRERFEERIHQGERVSDFDVYRQERRTLCWVEKQKEVDVDESYGSKRVLVIAREIYFFHLFVQPVQGFTLPPSD